MSPRYHFFIYVEKNLLHNLTCLSTRPNIRVKITSGSKIRGFKKFQVYDDDRDLAHRVVETVRRGNTYLAVLLSWDNRPADILYTWITSKYREVMNRIGIVHIRAGHSIKIPISLVLNYAEPGKYRKIIAINKYIPIDITILNYRRNSYKILKNYEYGNTRIIILEKVMHLSYSPLS